MGLCANNKLVCEEQVAVYLALLLSGVGTILTRQVFWSHPNGSESNEGPLVDNLQVVAVSKDHEGST